MTHWIPAQAWWRPHHVAILATILSGVLVAAVLVGRGEAPTMILILAAALLAVLGTTLGRQRAWLGAVVAGGCLLLLYLVTGERTIGLAMFTVPAFLAGTALRWHREATEQLAERGRELEDERELFTALSVQHERARIAAELHDVLGHAISVMVVQAAAGQRLVAADPVGARASLRAIADAAEQGQEDVQRLVDLLDGRGGATPPDLALVDDVLRRASAAGLTVDCRFEGDRSTIPPPAAHLALRAVQEGLTNALRHAPGSTVRVLLSTTAGALTIRVENDPPTVPTGPVLTGTGRGLLGLRERAQDLGGELTAGSTPAGGWVVEARLVWQLRST